MERERTVVILTGQRILENKGEKYASTTCGACGYGTTRRGRQLGAIHGEQLGGNFMMSCKGAEDSVIAPSSDDEHTHITKLY